MPKRFLAMSARVIPLLGESGAVDVVKAQQLLANGVAAGLGGSGRAVRRARSRATSRIQAWP